MSGVELSRMLASLRAELWKAQQEGDSQDIKFDVKDVELELQVTVADEGSGKGGVKFLVFNAEVGGKTSSQSVQKIKLKLTPKTKSGDPIAVADEDERPE